MYFVYGNASKSGAPQLNVSKIWKPTITASLSFIFAKWLWRDKVGFHCHVSLLEGISCHLQLWRMFFVEFSWDAAGPPLRGHQRGKCHAWNLVRRGAGIADHRGFERSREAANLRNTYGYGLSNYGWRFLGNQAHGEATARAMALIASQGAETAWADDLALYFQHPNPDDLISNLQTACAHLFNTCMKYGLQPNYAKGKTELLVALRGHGAVKTRHRWFTEGNGYMLPIPGCCLTSCTPLYA